MLTAEQQAALVEFKNAARQSGHIFPEAAACEAAVETTWGVSQLFREDCNVFGMKQQVHPVYGTVVIPTREFLQGAWTTVNAAFVKYPNVATCFADRMSTLMRLRASYPHYAAALAATSPEQYLTEVSASWSTGPNRAQACISILHAHADLLR